VKTLLDRKKNIPLLYISPSPPSFLESVEKFFGIKKLIGRSISSPTEYPNR
jgi:hypothetical protein